MFLKLHDHYKFTEYDRDFMELIQLMLTADAGLRPSAASLLEHRFITKWEHS